MALPLNLPFSPGGSSSGLTAYTQGLQAALTPAQIQAALAQQMSKAQYYQGRGQQGIANANLANTRAALESQGLQGNLGQMYLLSQRPEINQNPEQSAMFQTGLANQIQYGGRATAEQPGFLAQQIQILKNTYPNSPMIDKLQSRLDQIKANTAAQIAERNASAAESNARATIGIPAEGRRDDAESNYYPSASAEKIAQARKAEVEAQNAGYSGQPLNTSVSQSNAQGSAYGQTLPKENFQSWKLSDQANYIANNNTAPPLPAGTAITQKVDPKSEARMNGLAPSADAINFIQDKLNDPNIQKYMGKNVSSYIRAGLGQVTSAGGNMPEDYADYKAFVSNAQAMIADTIATTQTGSRSFGMMQQFQKIFDPSQKLSLQEAQKAVKDAGNILYNEGLSYVGQPYEPGLRNAAFNGVKKLQSSGFGNQSQLSNQKIKTYNPKTGRVE